MVAGPGVPHGRREEMAVYLQDIMPTILEYAGGQVPDWVEFNSLKPLIEKERDVSNYPEVYGAYMDLQRMIRIDNYKLIVYPKAGVVLLFNLIDDPSEMRNLAGAGSEQERVRSMLGKLEDLQLEMGDTLDLSDFKWIH
jgi:arylsulfatase A-like enzyme